MGGDGAQSRPPGHRRVLLASLAALIAVIPVVIGIVIGTSSGAQSHSSPQTLQLNQAPSPATATSAARTQPAIPGGSGSLVALLLHRTALRATPGGRNLAQLATKTQFGSPAAFWVVEHTPGWLGVMSSEAGNNRVAWIAQSSASLGRVPWEIEVSTRSRRLTVLDGGKVVARFTVAVGVSSAPTPSPLRRH